MRESKCYISVACFHYGGSDLLRFGKFEVLITSQALLSQKQPIFMQNYNFVKNDIFVAKICKYALYESSEGLFCAPRKAANFCHPVWVKIDSDECSRTAWAPRMLWAACFSLILTFVYNFNKTPWSPLMWMVRFVTFVHKDLCSLTAEK